MDDPQFTWGDTVRVTVDAPVELRPGEFGDVVAITSVDSPALSALYGVPVGGLVLMVEFGNGEALEIPSPWVVADPVERS